MPFSFRDHSSELIASRQVDPNDRAAEFGLGGFECRFVFRIYRESAHGEP